MANTYNGVRVPEYNTVTEGAADLVTHDGKVFNGFYVSYNYETRTYGCVTTALVVGQMEKFYILKGDHRAAYDALVSQGFDKCFEYYKANIAESHNYSDLI